MKKLIIFIAIFIGLSAQSQNLIGFTSEQIVQILKLNKDYSLPAYARTVDNTQYLSFHNAQDDNVQIYYLNADICYQYEIRTCKKYLAKYKNKLDAICLKKIEGNWIVCQNSTLYEVWIDTTDNYISINYVTQTEK